ncbi:hypothetical protein OH77DRAFT_1026804 [Trametes cingulata]|nr:hypothetical protein OH77DRAFT_1026804 [Trametes cingulata]
MGGVPCSLMECELCCLALELQEMLSETSARRLADDDDKLKAFVHLIGILLGLQNRIVSPHEVSEEQGALGNLNCKALNHLDLCRFEELLGFLTVAHSPARQFLRLDFILAFRNFLGRVKSRCDWDDISQGVIDTCESLLRELELQVQRDSRVSSSMEFRSPAKLEFGIALSPVAPSAPITSQWQPPLSEPVPEQAQSSLSPPLPIPPDVVEPCAPEPTPSSSTSIGSSEGPAPASRSPASELIQEHAETNLSPCAAKPSDRDGRLKHGSTPSSGRPFGPLPAPIFGSASQPPPSPPPSPSPPYPPVVCET